MAKLLVSDDDPQVLDLVSLVLEDAGHSVVATGDPHDVHDLARQPGIDAIVLDVDMPKSGYEVLSELRGDPATASLPILFLSGLNDQEERARGLVEGADDYMVKPFAPEELVLRVDRLLAWKGGKTPRRRARSDGKRRFGRYEVLDVIGQGSMGTVYRGRDPRLERPVALKTIRLESSGLGESREEMLERLRNEAITIARFNHPHIVAVYDMGDVEDSAFIAMELVEGLSLGDYLQRAGPLAPERTIPMAVAVADALAAAHAREVIHRDVKPGNVLLGRDGAIKVSDFGLAFVLSSLSRDDSTEISGTPGYVPPEVMAQKPYTESGDLFGLGATLYQSLSGVHPLVGPTLRDTIMNTLECAIVPLGERLGGLPAELETVVMALLASDPETRPRAAEVHDRLRRLARDRDLHWSPAVLPP